jgi:hypothetical protein
MVMFGEKSLRGMFAYGVKGRGWMEPLQEGASVTCTKILL